MAKLLIVLGLIIGITAAQKSLQQLHIIVTDGSRTPDNIDGFPSNSISTDKHFPYGNGGLTYEGKKSTYRLGLLLKNYYGKFLGPTYYEGLLQSYTPALNRMQMTLQIILSALFPPTSMWELYKNLKWQPIPYNILNNGKYIDIFNYCPKIKEVTSTPDDAAKELLSYIEETENIKLNNNLEVLKYYEKLRIQKELNLTVPDWVNAQWNAIRDLAKQGWLDLTNQHLPDLTGDLLNKIVTDTKNKISQEISEKLFLYSGFDTSIVSLLVALDTFKMQTIDHNSFISFELHQIKGEYGFMIYLYNHESSYKELLTIPRCGGFCKLEDLEKIASDLYNERKCV